MGSCSNLRISRLNIAGSKNAFLDCSDLFTKFDHQNVTHYYADNFTLQKPGFSRKLKNCKVMLDLLGFRIDNIKQRIENLFSDFDFLSYEKLVEISSRIDIHTSIYDEIDKYLDTDEFSAKVINILKSDKILNTEEDSFYDLQFSLESIEPYEILSLFLNNGLYLEENIVWEYYDLLEGGWIDEGTIENAFAHQSKFLLITEGSTDTKILSNAFEWLKPEIADLFEFIDMEKNYPFTGVGNIVNFYHGLLKIEPKKRIIFLFDNDTAGNSAINRCIKSSNDNFKLLTLPEKDEFNSILTIGPSGESIENINGKAVSIELFLDLNYPNSTPPLSTVDVI